MAYLEIRVSEKEKRKWKGIALKIKLKNPI